MAVIDRFEPGQVVLLIEGDGDLHSGFVGCTGTIQGRYGDYDDEEIYYVAVDNPPRKSTNGKFLVSADYMVSWTPVDTSDLRQIEAFLNG